MDGEVLHLIGLRGEMELEFAKIKKSYILFSSLKLIFKFETLAMNVNIICF